jgi:oligosaccharide repeat unit polymerase
MTSIAIIRAIRLTTPIFFDIRLIAFFIFALFFMLLTGERDVFFRVIFISLLIYYDKKRNSNFFIVISLLIGVSIVVPISQSFKAILLSGEVNLNSIGLELILSNEFVSASRNFYSLLIFHVDHDISFFFNDILRAFIPSFFLKDLDINSTVSWYHNEFRMRNGFGGTSGWGFGLVAEGYLIGKTFGIFFIMSFYALVIGILYNIRYKSIYWYIFYLLSYVTAIYVIRADIANLLSQVFKIGGFSVLILYFSHKLIENKTISFKRN